MCGWDGRLGRSVGLGLWRRWGGRRRTRLDHAGQRLVPVGVRIGRRLGLVAHTVAVLVSTVPFAVEAGTVVTIVSVSDDPAAGTAGTLGAVQTIEPLIPTGGVVHVSAELAVKLLNSTPTGNWSDSTNPVEVAGP